MNELKSWDDFCVEKQATPEGTELTEIACPCCGRVIYQDITVLRSFPPKHRYFCVACGWDGIA